MASVPQHRANLEDPNPPKASTNLLLVHARKCSRRRHRRGEQHVPDGKRVFIFNGELRGVRIKAMDVLVRRRYSISSDDSTKAISPKLFSAASMSSTNVPATCVR